MATLAIRINSHVDRDPVNVEKYLFDILFKPAPPGNWHESDWNAWVKGRKLRRRHPLLRGLDHFGLMRELHTLWQRIYFQWAGIATSLEIHNVASRREILAGPVGDLATHLYAEIGELANWFDQLENLKVEHPIENRKTAEKCEPYEAWVSNTGANLLIKERQSALCIRWPESSWLQAYRKFYDGSGGSQQNDAVVEIKLGAAPYCIKDVEEQNDNVIETGKGCVISHTQYNDSDKRNKVLKLLEWYVRSYSKTDPDMAVVRDYFQQVSGNQLSATNMKTLIIGLSEVEEISPAMDARALAGDQSALDLVKLAELKVRQVCGLQSSTTP
jgi:hypothetical protein